MLLIREDPTPLKKKTTRPKKKTTRPKKKTPRVPSSSYSAAHNRLLRKRGRAADYICTDCLNPAQEWSYNGGSPEELEGPTKSGISDKYFSKYSPNPMDYSPRCRSCHWAYDRRTA